MLNCMSGTNKTFFLCLDCFTVRVFVSSKRIERQKRKEKNLQNLFSLFHLLWMCVFSPVLPDREPPMWPYILRSNDWEIRMLVVFPVRRPSIVTSTNKWHPVQDVMLALAYDSHVQFVLSLHGCAYLGTVLGHKWKVPLIWNRNFCLSKLCTETRYWKAKKEWKCLPNCRRVHYRSNFRMRLDKNRRKRARR